MTLLEGTLLALLIVMVLIWFACVAKLSRRLRERHPDQYAQMGLANMWDLGEWDDEDTPRNAGAVFALLRFLFRSEDLALRDAEISKLSIFMRWFFYAYLILFLLLIFSVLRHLDHPGQRRDAVEVPALQDFRRVIELEPANFEAYRSADRILSLQRRWGDVLEMWDRYIAKVPADAEGYFERGGTNFQRGDFAAAHADAAKACELGKAQACALAERLKSR